MMRQGSPVSASLRAHSSTKSRIALEHAIDLGLRRSRRRFRARAARRRRAWPAGGPASVVGVDRHAVLLEGLGDEHLRRIRLAVVCFPQVADVAMLGAEDAVACAFFSASVMPSHSA